LPEEFKRRDLHHPNKMGKMKSGRNTGGSVRPAPSLSQLPLLEGCSTRHKQPRDERSRARLLQVAREFLAVSLGLQSGILCRHKNLLGQWTSHRPNAAE